MASHRETELKFDCEPDFELPDLGGLIVVYDERRRLTATYWDTSGRRLLGSGVTLRHRSASDDSEDGWTLKLPVDESSSGGVVRDELSEPGSPANPPDRLVGLVRALTRGEEMSPVATLITDRRSIGLGTEFGKALVDVADDDVASRIGDTAGGAFRQIEIELLDPTRTDAMAVVAKSLASAGLSRSHHSSKLKRVIGNPPPSVLDRRPLDEDSTIDEVISALVGRSVKQLITNDPMVRLGDDMEAVHQARVATRRLRADLKLLRPVLDPDEVAELRSDLKWLGGLLGALRDTQVMSTRLQDQVDAIGAGSDTGADLARLLANSSDFHRAQLMSALSGGRYVDLLRQLETAVDAPPCRAGVDSEELALPFLQHRAAKRWKKVRHFERGLDSAPSDGDLHELRKEIKSARYAAQAAGRLGAPSKPFARAARVLQDELGELHDCVVEIAWLEGVHADVGADAAFLAGRLREQADQRRRERHTNWPKDWNHLDRRKLRNWMN